MKRNSHNTIYKEEFVDLPRHVFLACCEKCFFNTISMVDVNVQVKHSVVVLEQFENGKDDIVDITKPGCL